MSYKMVNYVIDNERAVYPQLVEQVIQMIIDKVLVPGDKLIPITTAAKAFHISNPTIYAAYSELELKQLVFRYRKAGYFICENAYKTAISIINTDLKKQAKEICHTAKIAKIDLEALNKIINETYNM